MPVYRNAHASDLRRGRYSELGRCYLITTITLNRRPVFTDFQHARLLVQAMRVNQQVGRARSLAWVIMPDHLHWLLSLESGSLSDLVRSIKGRSARAIQQKSGAAGSLWQPGFHDHGVRQEEDLASIARYVVANPLRAGIVKGLGDYPLWDSVWL
jgi:REP element-mobilizing transposase RayT